MKRLLLCIALMACLPVFAQDQPRGGPGNEFWVYRVKGGYRITGFQDQLIVTASTLEYVDRNVPSCLLRLTGNVEVRTKGTILEADEADFHCNVEPSGNVRFRAFPQQ